MAKPHIVFLSRTGCLAAAVAERVYALDRHLFSAPPETAASASTLVQHAHRSSSLVRIFVASEITQLISEDDERNIIVVHLQCEPASSSGSTAHRSQQESASTLGNTASMKIAVTLYHNSDDVSTHSEHGGEESRDMESIAIAQWIVGKTTGRSSGGRSLRWAPADVHTRSSRLEGDLVAYIRRRIFENMTMHWTGASASTMVGHHTGGMTPLPLCDAPFYVTSGNVRRNPTTVFPESTTSGDDDEMLLVVDPTAVGREGDIVFGRVCPIGSVDLLRNASAARIGATESAVFGASFTGGTGLLTSHGSASTEIVPNPTHVMDTQHEDLFFYESFFAIAPLGNRESSTHVNGCVPDEGILRGRDVVHWIAGESGLVGVLMSEGAQANRLAETSVAFQMLGILRYVKRSNLVSFETLIASPPPHVEAPPSEVGSPLSPPTLNGSNVNLIDIAVQPTSSTLTVPVICIAGTSAEAGKTTLAAKIVSILTDVNHLRVGCVKATGTGGLPDCDACLHMGAVAAFDQVDAGLPTTYTSPERVRSILPRAFLLCQDASVDVIVVELGGDIIWANNTTVLAMPMMQNALHRLFLICNDTMSAIGAREWLSGRVALLPYRPNQQNASASAVEGVGTDSEGTSYQDMTLQQAPLLPPSRVVYVASPFRNILGATIRAASVLGMPLPLDPNDMDAIAALLADIRSVP